MHYPHFNKNRALSHFVFSVMYQHVVLCIKNKANAFIKEKHLTRWYIRGIHFMFLFHVLHTAALRAMREGGA